MSIWAMTDDELWARTKALDAELAPLDEQCRRRAARAYILNRCAFCKRNGMRMNAGFCVECNDNLSNNTRTR